MLIFWEAHESRVHRSGTAERKKVRRQFVVFLMRARAFVRSLAFGPMDSRGADNAAFVSSITPLHEDNCPVYHDNTHL